ncbi:MAG: transcriptional regulator NrdR, partial [Nannocystaceae bacterium]
MLDSRDSGETIRRRRRCQGCGHRFTTRERIETTVPVVHKRDGKKQPFDRNKVLAGLKLACRKRRIPDAKLEEIATQVEQWSATRGEGELTSQVIGDRIMHHLYRLDQVAYVRFASVYRSFDTVDGFEHLLREIAKAEHTSIEGQRTLFEPTSATPKTAANKPRSKSRKKPRAPDKHPGEDLP